MKTKIVKYNDKITDFKEKKKGEVSNEMHGTHCYNGKTLPLNPFGFVGVFKRS